MISKLFAVCSMVAVGVLTGCAADADTSSEDATDAVEIEGAGAGDLEPQRAQGGRSCTSSEQGIAQQHAVANHTACPGHVGCIPHVTSCRVENGWIIYTWE